MSISYQVTQEVNLQTILWDAASFFAAGLNTGKRAVRWLASRQVHQPVVRIAAAVALLPAIVAAAALLGIAVVCWLAAGALIALWQHRPALATLLTGLVVASKTLALFALLAGAFIVAVTNPLPVVCLAGTIAVAYITYPR